MKQLVDIFILIFFISTTAICQEYVIDYSFNNGYTLVYKTPPPASAYQNAPPKTFGVINSAKKIVVPLQYKSIMPSGETGIKQDPRTDLEAEFETRICGRDGCLSVTSGVYLARLDAGRESLRTKMVRIR